MMRFNLRRTGSTLLASLKSVMQFRARDWVFSGHGRDVQFHVEVQRPSSMFRIVRDRLEVKGTIFNAASAVEVPIRVTVGTKSIAAHVSTEPDTAGGSQEAGVETGVRHFHALLVLCPGAHIVTVQCKGVASGWVTVRRTLVFVRFQRHSPRWLWMPSLGYRHWQGRELRALTTAIQGEIRRHIDAMVVRPTFSVIIDLTLGSEGVAQTMQSIRNQVYEPLEICAAKWCVDADTAAQLEAGGVRMLVEPLLTETSGSHCVFVEAGARLHSHALYEFASAINASPSVGIVYADEDVIDARGLHSDPFFKPDWSPDYLEVFNYIAFPCCYEARAAKAASQSECLYDLALRITEVQQEVVHIPKVLGHRRPPGARQRATYDGVVALQRRLSRTGRRGIVAADPRHRGCYSVVRQLTEQPLITIVVPTAGRQVRVGRRNVDLLTNVVSQVRIRSTYANTEVIVVDSGGLSDDQKKSLQEHDCLSISDPGRGINIARKINLGAAAASGSHLVILNDDIEILTPDWLERMLWHFQQPSVGVVGCRLLYPDGSIQHAGIVFVRGHPEHVRRRMAGDEEGYFYSTCAVRNYLAVTGACMMTRRDLFRTVGGYDEVFPTNYNDIDFCLKARQQGHRVLYDGRVSLTHLESVSRPPGGDGAEYEIFAHRWASQIGVDPYYNERVLNAENPGFIPHLNPRLV